MHIQFHKSELNIYNGCKKGYFPSNLKYRTSNLYCMYTPIFFLSIALSITMSQMYIEPARENVLDCQRYFVIYLFPNRKLYNNLLLKERKKKTEKPTQKKIENVFFLKPV